MKKALTAFFAVLFVGLGASSSPAATIGLAEWGVNLDGSVYDASNPLPASVNVLGFDFATGLGTITATVSGAGGHSMIAFFDHEIDETINTFFNEVGTTAGVLAAGQSWEIDEPGWVFGDIYTNFTGGALDNSIGISTPEDVSMALGWDFILAAGETAYIKFLLGTSAPSGFNLAQTDPDSGETVYFKSTLEINSGGTTPVPEPGTLLLLAPGLLGIAVLARRRIKA